MYTNRSHHAFVVYVQGNMRNIDCVFTYGIKISSYYKAQMKRAIAVIMNKGKKKYMSWVAYCASGTFT